MKTKQYSPCVYSTGNFTVAGLTCTATGSESAVIEGANSITPTNSSLTSSMDNKWGVMIYLSMSGDAVGNEGKFTMTGGKVIFTADGQTLSGDFVVDKISLLAQTLQNGSSLAGAVNSANTTKLVNLTLDPSGSWTVTADSYLTCLTDASGISGTSVSNIIGNEHTVYHNASGCTALNGQTYTLNGSGYLRPSN